jgi:hypothetical protein
VTREVGDFLVEHGLGPLERRLRLGGRLSLNGAPEQPVELCLTSSGAWLVVEAGRFVGSALNADDATRVRYQCGRLHDRLIVDEQTLGVPTGRAGDARRLIALGRLRSQGGERKAPRSLTRDRYLNADLDLARELAQVLLATDDDLIALVELDRDEASSALGPSVERRSYLVLSAERALWATLGELGDLASEDLNAAALRLSSHADGPSLSDGRSARRIDPKRKALAAQLCELAELGPAQRLSEAARRLHLSSESERVRPLLAAADARGDALSSLVALACHESTHWVRGDLSRCMAHLRTSGVSAEAAAEAFRRWQFSASAGHELLSELALLGADAEPWALALHRTLRARAAADRETSDEAMTRWDVELAEHELLAGEPARARSLAEARLQSLGLDEGAVEAPLCDTQPTLARLRLYEVLCRESQQRSVYDIESLAALARLEPLSEARLLALGTARSDDPSEQRLIARSQRVRELLAPGGLSSDSPKGRSDSPLPFDAATLDQRLRHPLARGGGRLATRLSELVAAVPEPDLGFLRDFCEELSDSRHADAARALLRATRLLGLPRVSAYVSHGARSVGLRAFGSSEPFILIGERHLSASGDYALQGSEFDFALGAELAHLAFGHQRVTAGEVWAGAAGKTKNALVALGFVLPVVVNFGGARAQRLLGRLGAEAFERATRGALRLPELFEPRVASSSEPIGQRNEELILAHRLVQLSADRAGLAIAQDLGGALRAMLLTRADYRELASAAAANGLVHALEARRSHSPAVADLMVRVRAVVAFYLSSDFEMLASP